MQRDELRQHLNDLGFYVINGPGDALEVNVIGEYEPLDIKLVKKALDKIHKTWYALLKERR